MSTSPVEPVVTPNEPPAAAATPPVPSEPPKVATPETKPSGAMPEDPAELQNMIRELRKENANRRASSNTAAEDAKKELAQTIGKALGLVEDEVVDPVKLTESLTKAQADARRAQVELAVFRNAATAGGDPAALLDSASFLASLATIDPADPAAVTAAVEAAVAANPRLGAAPSEPRPPAPNPAQGAAAGGGALVGLDAQIAAATAAGDFQKSIALKQQRAALAAKS